jgi:hypothetical protein
MQTLSRFALGIGLGVALAFAMVVAALSPREARPTV